MPPNEMTPPMPRRSQRRTVSRAASKPPERKTPRRFKNARKPRAKAAVHPKGNSEEMCQHVEIDEDDICPICQLLLCDPVITKCNHILCRPCMATWAEVSVTASSTILSVDEVSSDFDAATDLEARCPMCRSQTTASAHHTRALTLQARYPRAYAQREDEEAQSERSRPVAQAVTVCIGNRHVLVDAPSEGEVSGNMHDWTFFVRPSRTDIIEEVHVFLHPSFRQNRVIRTRSPYEVKRVGWGLFTIHAGIILKAGFRWVSSDAEDSPDGAPQGLLRLDWTLDFTGFEGKGSMQRYRLKVRNDRDWEHVSDEEERDVAEWNRMVRSYEQDGRYEPPLD